MFKLVRISIVIVTWFLTSLSFAGPGSSSGGDPKNAREMNIQKLIKQDLKSLMFTYVDNFNAKQFLDRHAFDLLQSLILKGLKEDISDSLYDTSGNCQENNLRRAASAEMGILKTKICFDPKFLADEGATTREILALAFHEHSHHFGFNEQDAILIETNISASYREHVDSAWACSAYCHIDYYEHKFQVAVGKNEVLVSSTENSPADALTAIQAQCERRFKTVIFGKGNAQYYLNVAKEHPTIQNSCSKL